MEIFLLPLLFGYGCAGAAIWSMARDQNYGPAWGTTVATGASVLPVGLLLGLVSIFS